MIPESSDCLNNSYNLIIINQPSISSSPSTPASSAAIKDELPVLQWGSPESESLLNTPNFELRKSPKLEEPETSTEMPPLYSSQGYVVSKTEAAAPAYSEPVILNVDKIDVAAFACGQTQDGTLLFPVFPWE